MDWAALALSSSKSFKRFVADRVWKWSRQRQKLSLEKFERHASDRRSNVSILFWSCLLDRYTQTIRFERSVTSLHWRVTSSIYILHSKTDVKNSIQAVLKNKIKCYMKIKNCNFHRCRTWVEKVKYFKYFLCTPKL